MRKTVIVAARRTAQGRFLGGLSTIPAVRLGAEVIKAIIASTKIDPDQIDEVIMGNVLQAGLYQNPARQAAIYGGVPPKAGAVTINKVCGSGLKSVMLADQAIRLGDADVIIAGGMENMSLAPHLLMKARTGYRLGNDEIVDCMVHDGLWDVYNDFHMGNTAELVSEKYKVSREDQDHFAVDSHRKAVEAIKRGDFKDEIVPISIPQPVFKKDGTVTAGNASTINDGAAAVLVMSEEKAKALGMPVLATIEAHTTGGMEPKWVMMAPVDAVGRLLKKTGGKIDDWDLVELNEAFSAQGLAVMRELKIRPERLNVNGGAVALGHPIGCSGARLLVTLTHAMKKRHAKKGMASLCLGGANAVAMSITM